MKKITMCMAAAATLLLAACGTGSGKLGDASLKTNEDSVSYAFGVISSNGLDEYVFSKEGLAIDSADLDLFVKGLIEGANLSDSKKDGAYYAGVAIGQQAVARLKGQLGGSIYGDEVKNGNLSAHDFMVGFLAAFKGDSTIVQGMEAQQLIQRLIPVIREEFLAPYKAENEKFMEDIAKQEGVKTLEGGVCYKVLEEGNGEIPADTSLVKVHYEGKTIDGNVFDSSYERGEPTTFRCNQVIPGWTTALTNMPVGSKWELYIPADMAYGESGSRTIKPNSTLIFTVELQGIE